MSATSDLPRTMIVVCVWPLLFGGVELLVFYKCPKRALFALAGGLATVISAFFFLFIGAEQFGQPGWLGVIVPACLVFVITLLGTYIRPALEGMTFDEWIADTKRRSVKR